MSYDVFRRLWLRTATGYPHPGAALHFREPRMLPRQHLWLGYGCAFVSCLCCDVTLTVTLSLIVTVTRSRTVVGYSYARDHNFGKEDDGICDPKRHFDHHKDRKIHIRFLLVKRQHLRGHPQ